MLAFKKNVGKYRLFKYLAVLVRDGALSVDGEGDTWRCRLNIEVMVCVCTLLWRCNTMEGRKGE